MRGASIRRAPRLAASPGVRALAIANAWVLAVSLSLSVITPCGAQPAAPSVTLAGSLGTSKALLVIDGQAHTLAVGASANGVTLRSLGDGQAEVEFAGRRSQLRLGSAARLGAANAGGAGPREIIIPVGLGGHFVSPGQINGKTVQFMVDTGATSIAMSQSVANGMGLDWQRGRRGISSTAGGLVPVHAINLTSVKLGGIEVFNVDAVVIPAEMPMVLLGNSFLSRFSMRRDGDVMRLEKK